MASVTSIRRKQISADAVSQVAVASGRPRHIVEQFLRGEGIFRDPLRLYWDAVRPGSGKRITSFMRSVRRWNGILRAPDPELGQKTASAFPWLWKTVDGPSGHVLRFPQIVCVSASEIPEGSLISDELHGRVLKAWDQFEQGSHSDSNEWEAKRNALIECAWLWGDSDGVWFFERSEALLKRSPNIRPILDGLELCIALTVELTGTQFTELRRFARHAALFWVETGNYPFATRMDGSDYELYVLVADPSPGAPSSSE